MRQRQLFKAVSFICDTDKEYLIKYYLLLKPSSEVHGKTLFGVAVENSNTSEYEEIPGMSYQKDEISEFLEKLCTGNVTPVSLFDIADDYIN